MRRSCLATTAFLLLPAWAAGEQLDYGASSRVGWTSNVFGTPENQADGQQPEGAYSTRLSPWAEVSDRDGDFNWSLRYAPSYEAYLDQSGANGFDQDVQGTLGWRATDRTTLLLTGAYQKYSSIARFNENSTTSDSVDLQLRRQEFTSNAASVQLRHALTPRDALSFFSSYQRSDFSQEFGSDRSTFSSGTNYSHAFTERTRAGARASWIQQTNSRDITENNVTNYYNLSAVFEHSFSRTLHLEAAVGPTLVESNNELISFAPPYGVLVVQGNAAAFVAENCPLLHRDQPEGPSNPRVAGIINFAGCAGPRVNPGSPPLTLLTPEEADLLGVKGLGTGQVSREFVQFGSSQLRQVDNAGVLAPLTSSAVGAPYLTYFARLALRKDWERWQAELVYQRSNDDSGSFGFASVEDSLSGSLSWQPARFWGVSLSTAYTLQDQANDAVVPTQVVVVNQPVPAGVTTPTGQVATTQNVIAQVTNNALTYTTASVALQVSRQLTAHSSAFFSVYWYHQTQRVKLDDTISGDDERVTRWNTLTFWIGLDWKFDTIKF